MKSDLSYKSYKSACESAYKVKMSNPTIFWNPSQGFYVYTGTIKTGDLSLGLCYYNLNCGGKRSHSGSKSEYYPIGKGIRMGLKAGFTDPEFLKSCIRDIENEMDREY